VLGQLGTTSSSPLFLSYVSPLPLDLNLATFWPPINFSNGFCQKSFLLASFGHCEFRLYEYSIGFLLPVYTLGACLLVLMFHLN
jgi:hypothetical protein